MLDQECRELLDQKIREILADNSCQVEALTVMPNHVHLEVVMPPWMSVTVLIKKLKGTTARCSLKKSRNSEKACTIIIYGRHHICKFYVGNCSEETIKHYVETQWERPFK